MNNDSAIDNATRSLMSMGQLPVTCGLFFSLGHSTIVIAVVRFVRLLVFNFTESLAECGHRH